MPCRCFVVFSPSFSLRPALSCLFSLCPSFSCFDTLVAVSSGSFSFSLILSRSFSPCRILSFFLASSSILSSCFPVRSHFALIFLVMLRCYVFCLVLSCFVSFFLSCLSCSFSVCFPFFSLFLVVPPAISRVPTVLSHLVFVFLVMSRLFALYLVFSCVVVLFLALSHSFFLVFLVISSFVFCTFSLCAVISCCVLFPCLSCFFLVMSRPISLSYVVRFHLIHYSYVSFFLMRTVLSRCVSSQLGILSLASVLFLAFGCVLHYVPLLISFVSIFPVPSPFSRSFSFGIVLSEFVSFFVFPFYSIPSCFVPVVLV